MIGERLWSIQGFNPPRMRSLTTDGRFVHVDWCAVPSVPSDENRFHLWVALKLRAKMYPGAE